MNKKKRIKMNPVYSALQSSSKRREREKKPILSLPVTTKTREEKKCSVIEEGQPRDLNPDTLDFSA